MGINIGIQQGVVDVGVGRAADLALAVPGIIGVNQIGPVLEVQLLALGAQIVVAVEHQDVLDDQAVGQAVILVDADLVCPGRRPVDELQVLVGAADDLSPAGLVETEEDIAVFLLVGCLDGGRVAGDDGVIVHRDGESSRLGLVLQPGRALGGVGVGVDADGNA